MDIKAQDLELVEALSLIALKAGLRAEIGSGLTGKVNLELKNKDVEEILSQLAKDQGIVYRIEGNTLYVNKSGSGNFGPDNVTEIAFRYTSALDIADKVKAFLEPNEKIIVDERNNSVIFYGSQRTVRRLRSFIRVFDRMPKQIVIESQIVETSKNFLRDIGFGWGTIDRADASGQQTSGIISAPGPTPANLSLRRAVGSIEGTALAIKLAAAESTGNATIISRPKVITLNNRMARIRSGITYHVKTLAAITGTTTGSGETTDNTTTSSSTVTGGLQTVEAGLELNVTPTLIGEDMVQMTIVMNNSTPDKGVAVDGIPGINSSSADTSVVVKQGHTAILAGLVKTMDSLSKNGVPILSDIPILGLLFSSRSEERKNNEVVIFMTPLIIDSPESLDQGIMEKQGS